MTVSPNPNYQRAIKLLDELMLELFGKGVSIPAHVVEELKAGRSFANIVSRSPDDTDSAAKAAFALQNVEMNLLAIAEREVDAGYAEAWQIRIIDAYNESGVQTDTPPVAKELPKVPKGEYWIRIQMSELKPFRENELDGLLENFSLSASAQKDGYTLIYGKKENVAAFLGEIRQKYKEGEVECKN